MTSKMNQFIGERPSSLMGKYLELADSDASTFVLSVFCILVFYAIFLRLSVYQKKSKFTHGINLKKRKKNGND